MPPLERLLRVKIEFHRRLRTLARSTAVTGDLHTSYALQARYEQLIGDITPSLPATWKRGAGARRR